MSKEITYGYFFLLGGLTNPKCSTRSVYNGDVYMYRRYFKMFDIIA